MQDFSIVKKLDKSSSKLILHCANGKHIPTAAFAQRKATGDGGQKESPEDQRLEDADGHELSDQRFRGRDAK